MTAQDWVARLGLAPHPEGGWYRETYRSSESVAATALPARFPGARAFATGIYYLLEAGDRSRLHRIRSDEMWHFYDGDPLTVWSIDAAGAATALRLGRGDGLVLQGVVPAGGWFGARVEPPGRFSLVGCTVAPGFEFFDLEMADRTEMLQSFPQHRALIESLTAGSRAPAPRDT